MKKLDQLRSIAATVGASVSAGRQRGANSYDVVLGESRATFRRHRNSTSLTIQFRDQYIPHNLNLAVLQDEFSILRAVLSILATPTAALERAIYDQTRVVAGLEAQLEAGRHRLTVLRYIRESLNTAGSETRS